MFEVTVKKYFSGAHRLRNYKGKCEALHGHNWCVEVSVKGKMLNGTGLLTDFTDLKDILSQVLSKLDHKYLNEISPFDKINPSAENIAKYVFKEFKKYLPNKKQISKVTVYESETNSVTYTE